MQMILVVMLKLVMMMVNGLEIGGAPLQRNYFWVFFLTCTSAISLVTFFPFLYNMHLSPCQRERETILLIGVTLSAI